MCRVSVPRRRADISRLCLEAEMPPRRLIPPLVALSVCDSILSVPTRGGPRPRFLALFTGGEPSEVDSAAPRVWRSPTLAADAPLAGCGRAVAAPRCRVTRCCSACSAVASRGIGPMCALSARAVFLSCGFVILYTNGNIFSNMIFNRRTDGNRNQLWSDGGSVLTVTLTTCRDKTTTRTGVTNYVGELVKRSMKRRSSFFH